MPSLAAYTSVMKNCQALQRLPLPLKSAHFGSLCAVPWPTAIFGRSIMCSRVFWHPPWRPWTPNYRGSRATLVSAAADVSSADTVLVVESPAKATKIQSYLGPAYKVLASYGHIRDLPPKPGAVDPAANFSMQWVVASAAKPRITAIKAALKTAHRLVLATDPDREGEAIAWHLLEELKDTVKGKEVQRITFTQVSKRAVEAALASPRALSVPLIEAYKGRRALDFLMGFDLSPVLWKKMIGSKSAGRVQSVALRLIAEREAEIEAFQPKEWWSVSANLSIDGHGAFDALLTHVGGKKAGQMDIQSGDEARALARRISEASFQVSNVNQTSTSRNPGAPFITSSMVQDAGNRLGYKVSSTMSTAQALFEGGDQAEGLITYIRTDSPTMDADAVEEVRQAIRAVYGKEYLAPAPASYKSKSKNAQEGHGAIAPVNPLCIPPAVLPSVHSMHGTQVLPSSLSHPQQQLYDLIWRRTLASQMAPANYQQVVAEFTSTDGALKLRASASQVVFAGFLKALGRRETGQDGSEAEDEAEEEQDDELQEVRQKQQAVKQESLGKLVGSLQVGQQVRTVGANVEQHFTQGPPHYSEARLVRTLEEKGIGRPSTYAPVISTLQDRGYVTKEGRRLQATSRGRVLSAFLQHYFARYVDYDFTSDMESQLDEVAGGQLVHTGLLQQFYQPFREQVDLGAAVPTRQIIDVLDANLAPHFFLAQEGQSEEEARACPACAGRGSQGRLGLKLSKTGGFIGCSSYPDCSYARPLELPSPDAEEEEEQAVPRLEEGPRALGLHPKTKEEVSLHKGRFGFYVQLGDSNSPSAVKKRSSRVGRSSLSVGVPTGAYVAKTAPVRGESASSVTLESALQLLQYPLLLGEHPEGGPVTLNNGPYSFYVQHERPSRSHTRAAVPEEANPTEISFEQACGLLALAQKAKSAGGSSFVRQKVEPCTRSSGAKPKSTSKAKPKASSKAKSKSQAASKSEAAAKGAAQPAEAARRKSKSSQAEQQLVQNSTAVNDGPTAKKRGRGRPPRLSQAEHQAESLDNAMHSTIDTKK